MTRRMRRRPCRRSGGGGGRTSRGRSYSAISRSSASDQKKFAEPVSLSSTLPTNFRLPPTAARLGFDLLALRARRKRHSRDVKGSVQGLSERRVRNLQKIQFSTFSTGRKAVLWISLGNFADKCGSARPRWERPPVASANDGEGPCKKGELKGRLASIRRQNRGWEGYVKISLLPQLDITLITVHSARMSENRAETLAPAGAIVFHLGIALVLRSRAA
jgi:hypothetical protein